MIWASKVNLMMEIGSRVRAYRTDLLALTGGYEHGEGGFNQPRTYLVRGREGPAAGVQSFAGIVPELR